MKFKILIISCLVSFGLLGMSMTLKQSDKIDVPEAVLKTFHKKYPKAKKVEWEMEDEDEYEAEFKNNGDEMSATFKADGTWLESETEIKNSALPQAVKDAIANQFKGYEVEEAEKLETPEIPLAYEVTLENEEEETEMEVVFSPDGKVLKKEIKDDEEDDEDDDGDDDDGKGKY